MEQARAIVAELKQYDAGLHRKPRWLVLNKIDAIGATDRAAVIEAMRAKLVRRLRTKAPIFAVSAVTGEGCPELMWAVQQFLDEQRRGADAAAAADKSAGAGDVRFEEARSPAGAA